METVAARWCAGALDHEVLAPIVLMISRRSVVVSRATKARSRGLGVLGAPAVARADGEAWVWTEHQVRLVDDDGELPKTNLRLTTNARFSGRADGLDFGLVRAGPVFAVAPWFSFATTGAAVAVRAGSGAFVQEYRGELDLVPHTKVGDFVLTDRARFEYVWRDAGAYVRHRNMVRVAYAPAGATWIPFAFVDLFLRPTKPNLQETWSALGLGRVLGGGARLDVAYMLRTRDGSGGELDHVAWLMLFFGVPPSAPRPTQPTPTRGSTPAEPTDDAVD